MRLGVSDPNDIAAYGLMLNRVTVAGVQPLQPHDGCRAPEDRP